MNLPRYLSYSGIGVGELKKNRLYRSGLDAKWKYVVLAIPIAVTFCLYSAVLFVLSMIALVVVGITTVFLLPLVLPDMIKSMLGFGHLHLSGVLTLVQKLPIVSLSCSSPCITISRSVLQGVR